jgi:transposase-like protein
VSDRRCLVIENWQAVIPHAGLDLVAENARLRRQNERLRTEREIQKKRSHFFGSAEMNAVHERVCHCFSFCHDYL